MLNTLVSKVSTILEKDFLFGSFLPALMFITGVLGTFAGVTGTLSTVAVAESWPAQALWTTLVAVLIVLLAFVLKGLRPLLTGLWAGREELLLSPPDALLTWGAMRERARLAALERVARADLEWPKKAEAFLTEIASRQPASPPSVPEEKHHLFQDFFAELAAKVTHDTGAKQAHAEAAVPVASKPEVPQNKVSEVLESVRSLRIGDADKVDNVVARVYELYDTYDVSQSPSLWSETHRHLRSLARSEGLKAQEALGRRDREFGVGSDVRATRLGNVIDAYQQYSFTRYRMEAEIFWPRLVSVMKAEDLARVDDRRVVLDFALTSTSLAVGYSALAILAGPWAWREAWWLWAVLAVAGVIAGRLCYTLAVSAAIELGEAIRAAFDLRRLDLLAVLGGGRPTSLKEERKLWEKLSQLAVYGGDGLDFEIQPKAT